MRFSLARSTTYASWSLASLALACSDPPVTSPPPGSGGTTAGSAGTGGSSGTAGTKSTAGTAGNGFATGGSTAAGGTTVTGGGAGTNGQAGSSAGISAGGSTTAAGGSGTSGSANGGAGGNTASGGAGGAAPGGSGNAGPVDCSGITGAGYELCASGADFCAAVFDDGAGCRAVCAAAGLSCSEVWENEEGSCAPDMERDELSCDSDHESDYCVCRGGAGGTGAGGSSGASSSGGSTSVGGAAGSGGASSGGAGGSGAGQGGKGGGSGGGGGGNVPAVGPGPCGCEDPAGEFGTVDATIVVGPGQVYDGQCRIYRANPETLGSGDQEEGQQPVFRVEDGGVLRNVVLGASAADGVHTYGDVTLENIHWLDIGEDAMTIKESGTVYVTCGSATNGEDKVFQFNAASEVYISHFTASNAGKFIRQNGGTDFEVNVTIDHCDISSMDEVIFRTDSSSSHVTLTNSRYSDLGDGLFMFGDDVVNGNSAQSTVSNNREY